MQSAIPAVVMLVLPWQEWGSLSILMQGQPRTWETTVLMEQVSMKDHCALLEGLPQECRAAVNQPGSRLAARLCRQHGTMGIAHTNPSQHAIFHQ